MGRLLGWGWGGGGGGQRVCWPPPKLLGAAPLPPHLLFLRLSLTIKLHLEFINTKGLQVRNYLYIQSNFNGSNTFGTMKISSRQG